MTLSGCRCCFCGASIERRGSDPVTLTIPLESGGTEQLFCHGACLRRALHPSVRLFDAMTDEEKRNFFRNFGSAS
jgi:hypothetical protein